MEALSGSYRYCKFCATNQRDKVSVFMCSKRNALSTREIGFIVHQKCFSLATDSFRIKRVRSVSAVSSSAPTYVDGEEIQINSSEKAKTVRVRIKLVKECTFGEQFLLVGDDPVLGLWDPSGGVLLDWSEGHVWTAEMDIPVGKVIKYKFILKGINGDILWQNGADRVFETWETERIISVSEDWDDPGFQNVVEEELVDDQNEVLMESNLSKVLVEEDLSSCDEVSAVVSLSDEERDETSILSRPVLVPGLVLSSNEAEYVNSDVEIVKYESDEIEKQNSDEAIEGVNDVTAPTESFYSTETGEMVVDEGVNDVTAPTESFYSTETSEMVVDEMETNILGSDMQWGRRTLQKFLANFGF